MPSSIERSKLYVRADGTVPVREFLEDLHADQRARFELYHRLLDERALPHKPWTDPPCSCLIEPWLYSVSWRGESAHYHLVFAAKSEEFLLWLFGAVTDGVHLKASHYAIANEYIVDYSSPRYADRVSGARSPD